MRKRGNNKRQPRTTGAATKCISIMPDGTASYFTPKKKPSRKGIAKVNGEYIRTERERALQ